jgi:hypothetical protein
VRIYASQEPFVVADFDHAIDTWRWMLRLNPDASMAAQMAALLHDAERLVSERDVRVEHLAPDYQAFKDEHARRGGEIARAVLLRARTPIDEVRRVVYLVEGHERRSDDPEQALLGDADALSFLSLTSPSYVDYFGVDQARRKVRYTLGRLRHTARARLAAVRLRDDVRTLVREEAV